MRPQLDETGPAFQAIERSVGGNGWAQICRHGQEKFRNSFPPHVQDVDVKALYSSSFYYPLWREGESAGGAGGGGWVGGGGGGGVEGGRGGAGEGGGVGGGVRGGGGGGGG